MKIINPYKFLAGGTSLKTGLVACWELDEESGSTAYDAHSNGYDATNTLCTVNQTGLLNKAYSLSKDATNYVKAPSTLNFNNMDITIACWAKWTGTISNEFLKEWMSFFIKGQYYASCEYQILYNRQATGARALNLYVNGVGKVGTSIDLGTNWRHIAATYDHQYVRMYVDGQSVGTPSAYTTAVNESAYDFHMGGRDRYHFDGLIDQTAIWSRALTASEISTLYNSGNGLAYANW